MRSISLDTSIIVSFARLFEQSFSVYRKPSHSEISKVLQDLNIADFDPKIADPGLFILLSTRFTSWLWRV